MLKYCFKKPVARPMTSFLRLVDIQYHYQESRWWWHWRWWCCWYIFSHSHHWSDWVWTNPGSVKCCLSWCWSLLTFYSSPHFLHSTTGHDQLSWWAVLESWCQAHWALMWCWAALLQQTPPCTTLVMSWMQLCFSGEGHINMDLQWYISEHEK